MAAQIPYRMTGVEKEAQEMPRKELAVASEGSPASIIVDHEIGVVDWDGPNDVQNPMNWSQRKRWSIIVAISAITFNQAMSSTIFAPGVPQAMKDLHSDSQAVSTLLISTFVIGLAVGPIFLCPLTELYGRVPLMHLTSFTFMLAAVICAVSPNVPLLLVFRLVMGISTISLGGGYVADLMQPEDRSRAMNVWTVGPVLAPVVGPIAGGYICESTSWRWTFGLVAITGAITFVLCLVFLPETYSPRLLEIKANKLRTSTGNLFLRSTYDKHLTPTKLLRVSIIRPMRMLVHCPVVGLVSLTLAIAYSYMYLMFTTFTEVFKSTYNFNSGEVGLSFIGIGIGSLLGQYVVDIFLKRYRNWRIKRTGEAARPEDQLPPSVAAGILLAAGLLWYGWTLEYRVHWIVPIIGTVLCGVGISFAFLAVQTYLVEAFTMHAASALAANTLIRCIFGMLVPLAGPPLYDHLGLGWGNSLLAFLSLLTVPTSWWLWRSGEKLRTIQRFMPDL